MKRTSEELARDGSRSAFLQTKGYQIIRFNNTEALEGMDELLVLLRGALNT